jgi:hypothetical protein
MKPLSQRLFPQIEAESILCSNSCVNISVPSSETEASLLRTRLDHARKTVAAIEWALAAYEEQQRFNVLELSTSAALRSTQDLDEAAIATDKLNALTTQLEQLLVQVAGQKDSSDSLREDDITEGDELDDEIASVRSLK